MSIVEKLKARLLEARKAKDELAKGILSVALGDIQTQSSRAGQKGEMTEQQAEKIVQKLIKSNQETIKSANLLATTILVSQLENEITILTALMPKALSKEEMLIYLSPFVTAIKEAKSDGQATGLAMKQLASIEGTKDGKIVAEIVKELRG